MSSYNLFLLDKLTTSTRKVSMKKTQTVFLLILLTLISFGATTTHSYGANKFYIQTIPEGFQFYLEISISKKNVTFTECEGHIKDGIPNKNPGNEEEKTLCTSSTSFAFEDLKKTFLTLESVPFEHSGELPEAMIIFFQENIYYGVIPAMIAKFFMDFAHDFFPSFITDNKNAIFFGLLGLGLFKGTLFGGSKLYDLWDIYSQWSSAKSLLKEVLTGAKNQSLKNIVIQSNIYFILLDLVKYIAE